MNGLLAFAFVTGTVATANPCGFALLPAYLARQIGMDRSGTRAATAVIRALLVGAVTTAGFLLVFGTVGTAISLGARSVTRVVPWAALAIGVVLFATGIALLAGKRIAVPLLAVPRPAGRGFASVFLFGLGYGTASLSCTLPVFLAVIGTAITADPVIGVLSFAAYGTGMGTMLTALAVAAALSRTGLANATRRVLPRISRISGALLAAAGAYVVYYWSFALGFFGTSVPTLIQTGERLSSRLQGWIQTTAGQTVSIALLAGIAALIAWTVWRTVRPATPPATASDEPDNTPAAADDYANIQVPAELAERLRTALTLQRAPATLGEMVEQSPPAAPPPQPEHLYTQQPTRHQVRINGHVHHTHCVIDALLLAYLTQETVELRSESPLGGHVTAHVGPDRIEAAPSDTVVSFGLARTDHVAAQPACPYINAFPSREAYQRWSSATPQALTICLSMQDAAAFSRAMGRRNPACVPGAQCC